VTVVTTKNNFKKLSEFVDSATYEQYKKQFLFVETDSLVIKDAVNSVVLYKCNHADYGYIPTDDFLYCYLPKYQCLQTSCMYQRLGGTQIRNKEMISGRVENLYSFIKSTNLHPVSLLCTDNEYDAANGTISIDSLEDVMKKGIGMVALENELLSINETTLIEKDDSLLKAFVINPTAHSVFNKVVYSCLEKQQLRRALGYAKLQALLYPSDPNSWDTYGEVYYFLGEIKVAKRMEIQSTRIDKDFKAGEKTWQEDLEEYKKKWTGEK
jgi:hypothetical protein